jgi:hypothetical protein
LALIAAHGFAFCSRSDAMALGTAHEPSVGRYTGYGSGLLYGELERLWHAQQNGATLIAGLRDLTKHLLDLVGVQALAFCPSKSFFALQRDHTAIMDARLPDKVRLGIETSTGVVIAYQEVRTATGFIQARCSNLLRGVGSKTASLIRSLAHKVNGRETPRGLGVVGLAVYDLFDHHHPPVSRKTVT